ncbi:MAG: hypothetical protein ACO1SX_11340 [Actinomycetota bacterium]
MKASDSSNGERQAAKSALRDAERTWDRTRPAYLRLFRERQTIDPVDEPSEAEVRAERAYRSAAGALSAARERLELLELAAPPVRNGPRRPRYPSERLEVDDGPGS